MATTVNSGILGGVQGHNPPYIDGNGNIYVFVLVTSTLRCFKSSNGGTSFTEQNSGSAPSIGTTSFGMGTFQDGTAIHIITQTDTGSAGNPTYHRFNTSDAGASPDTWAETGTTIETLSGTASNEAFASIVVRSSGDRVVTYSGDMEKIHGTDYQRASVAEYVSSWTVLADYRSGTTFEVYYMVAGLGASGKVHIVADGSSRIVHMSLADGATSFSAAETINVTTAVLPSAGARPPVPAYRDSSGTELVMTGWKKSSDSTLYTSLITSDGTPAAEAAGSDNAINDQYSAPKWTAFLIGAGDHPTSSRFILVYADSSTEDIYFDQNTGSGWGTDTEAFDAVTATKLGANTWTASGGSYVLAVNWTDGTNVYFDTYELVAGGSVTPISVAGATTPAGALVKRISKVPVGATSPAGALAKLSTRSFSGADTPAGSLFKTIQKIFAGADTPTGGLASLKTVIVAFVGAVSPSGTLTKFLTKTFSGADTPAGVVTKQTTLSAFTGSATPTGALRKLYSHVFSGSTSPTGALATLKSIILSISGAVTPAGVLAKLTSKSFSGSDTPTGAVVKLTTKPLSGSDTPTGALRKTIQKSFAGADTPTGALATLRSIILAIAGSVTPAGALAAVKSVFLSIAGAVSPSGSFQKIMRKSLTGADTPTGALVKSFTRTFSGADTPSGSLTKRLSFSFQGSATPTGNAVVQYVSNALDVIGRAAIRIILRHRSSIRYVVNEQANVSIEVRERAKIRYEVL